MNDNTKFKKLLQIIGTKEEDDIQIDITQKLMYIVDFIRPKNEKDIESTLESIDTIISFFESKDQIATAISDQLNSLFIESKISHNICSLGILSRNGLSYEIKERFYNKFLPNPPKKGDISYILDTVFYEQWDHKWVNKIDNDKWIELFSSLFSNSKYAKETVNHLFSELLYAMEILSIWIASEEFDYNFIRLDKNLLNDDSAFIALQRDIGSFVHKIQKNNIDIDSTKLNFKHLEVLIAQCDEQVERFKKKSVNLGISLDLTYELERLSQIIQRLESLLKLIKNFATQESYFSFVELFKESIAKNATKNSLIVLYKQSSRIIAKSITNNASEHGEHYITNNLSEYKKMFISAAGAGIVIAFMALFKINIIQAEFSQGVQTILTSLNYGLGFVLIHLLGFVVATKQPAMTASTFAQTVEKEDKKSTANQKKLVNLIFDVSRSQFAAVFGNVLLALFVAFGIAFFVLSSNSIIFLNSEETKYYLDNLEPFSALLFAAIAGIWLFCSGLIAGYFDNRADLLELEQRYFHHPLLKKLLGDKRRERLAHYLHEHHGAIAGNFFFGVLLGITPYIGYLLGLPLDIAHVAFSSAYLGFASTSIEITTGQFLYYLGCVLLIGAVNLFVSFILALKVSLVARDTYFGNLFTFLKLLFTEIVKRPHQLLFPFKNKKEDTQK